VTVGKESWKKSQMKSLPKDCRSLKMVITVREVKRRVLLSGYVGARDHF